MKLSVSTMAPQMVRTKNSLSVSLSISLSLCLSLCLCLHLASDSSVDAGSTKLLKAMAAHREDTRVVILSRNFGQTAAMAAGFDFAVGQLLVTLDGDLQNDADDIPALLDHLIRGGREGDDEGSAIVAAAGVVDTGVVREDGGFDLVCGWRRNRKDNFLTRNLPSTVANWLIGNVTGVKLTKP
jgi:glycosyltransferase involved in cell wall biosynthesis